MTKVQFNVQAQPLMSFINRSNTAQTEPTSFHPCARCYFVVDTLTSAATAKQGDD